jgi:thioredoxin
MNFMKNAKLKVHIIILAGLFAVLLASCGKKEDKSVNYNTPVDQNTATQNPVTNNNLKSNPEPVKKENINKENNTKGSTKMVHLTAAEFKQKVFNYETQKEWKFTGDVPVIIDFYADWCGPCKMVAPVLEELSKEYDGKVQIYKIDTEAEQELAQVFGIRSIPSILFIPMEGKPQMSMGALPKESFVKAINEILLVN